MNEKVRKPRALFTVRRGQHIYMISLPKDIAKLIEPGMKFRFELTEDGFRYRKVVPEQLPEWLSA